ncbi:MAG: amidase [Verrucomicrobia bacterium]|nr:amidase [Verrucomicrobiota bacterium]
MSARTTPPPLNRRRFLASLAATGAASTLFASRLRAEAAASSKIPDDPLFTSATRLAALVRAKKLSSTEIVTACIKRIEAVNPKLNAVVFPIFERALAEAKFADEATAKSKSFGPLHGVPCTMKDSHDVAGVVSTGGTLGRKNFIPARDATYVARVRAAGAIVMGKTNTPELTLSGQTTNLIYGKTHNPYKLGYQPGGSTGGGASIIAAGGSPFDIGTDFGGSIRGPSHFCGIAGIKPTTGRVPRTGHIVGYGGFFDSFQVIGPMARWVEDLALIMPLISGPDYIDAAIAPAPWLEPKDVDLKKIRVVYYLNNGSEKPLTPETEAAVKATVKLFSDLGVTVVEDCPTALIRESQETRNALSSADGRAWTKRMLAKYGTTQVSPVISLADSPQCDLSEFTRLADQLDANRSKFLQWIKPYDLLICPANRTPAEPWPEDLKPQVPDPKNIGFTTTYNNTGWPGAVVRAGFSPDGLPIGVQLIAQPWREDVSLAAAAFVESAPGFGYVKPTAV